jgi:hypothetical protein
MNLLLALTTSGKIDSALPYALFDTSGSWAKEQHQACFGIRYGATYISLAGAFPPNTTAAGDGTYASNTTSGSGGDERGNRFVLPVPARCVGARFSVWASPTGDYKVNLRDASGTLLASSPTLSAAARGSAPEQYITTFFTAPFSLAAGTEYFITREAMTTTTIGELWGLDVTSNAQLGFSAGGVETDKVALTDGASITKTNTRVLSIVPMLDQFHDGVSGTSVAANPLGGFVR